MKDMKVLPKRDLLVCFYQSALGRAIYSQRRISIEPLIEHIKSVFRIDPLSASEFQPVSAIVYIIISLALSDNGFTITIKGRK
jgi:hypothetical protein